MNKLRKGAEEEVGDAMRAKSKMLRSGHQGTVDAMRMRADEMMGSKPEYIERERNAMMRNDYKEKADAMRDRADQRTAASMRDEEYKKGGKVKKANCYAAGGVAKIRLKQATASGKPIMLPRSKTRGA